MSITIRPAAVTDFECLLDLVKVLATTFVVDANEFQATLPLLLQQEDALLLVAETNDGVVGYCLALDHLTFFANGRVTWVEELAVQPGLQRTGVGRKLMEEVERWASIRGSRIVALATRRASNFYRAIGYEESATYFRKLVPAIGKVA